MKEPRWLTLPSVLILHHKQLEQFGGSAGIRDLGLIESALAAPRHLYTYGDATVSELAAAYAYGLVRNHGFVDGNKRIGFILTAMSREAARRRD